MQPEIKQAAQCLLAKLRYTGLIEVEFKLDRRDRQYKLLDMNPRVWGWISLSAKAGVDFPYLFWRLSQQEALTPARGRAGVHWVRLTTDLPAALVELWRGHLSPLAYLRSFSCPLEFAVFAKDDPLPWMLEVPLLSIAKWKRWRKLKAATKTRGIV